MSALQFPFRFHPAFRLVALPFRVRPETCQVEIVGEHLIARFGHWQIRTTLSNVRSARVTTDYAWPKVIGPPRLSLRDRGLTFATNPDAGVCIEFEEPVAGVEPLGLIRHPSLTVTVEDVAGLAELLDRSSHDDQRTHVGDRPDVIDLVEEVHDELASMTAAELRERAKERGVPGVSRRSKAELVDLLGNG